LAGLLLVLTVASGMIDSVSILRLGHVFAAAMTGNLLFVGFALAGAPGFSIVASLDALGAFVIGSFVGGAVVERTSSHRSQLLRDAAGFQLGSLVAATAILAVVGDSPAGGTRYLLVAVLAVGMGVQTAAVRHVGIREVTTTVLTTTLSTLISDLRPTNWRGPAAQLRVLAVLAEVGGAVVGALLVLNTATWSALAVAGAVAAAVAVLSHAVSGKGAAWNDR
jgi:uncharacterized membrane protein YoaK (UPF0700 family)